MASLNLPRLLTRNFATFPITGRILLLCNILSARFDYILKLVVLVIRISNLDVFPIKSNNNLKYKFF